MPDKSLEQALLSRPEINGPVNLPEGDPNAIEAKILRYAKGLAGVQEPGDLPSALGAATTLSLPLLSKLAKLLPAKAAVTSGSVPEMMPGFRMNMHEFEPVTAGQRPPINDEGANLAFAQMQRAGAGKRPSVTIDELNNMMATSPRHPDAPMSSGEVMKRMADLKQYRQAAAEQRDNIIPFPIHTKEK